MLPCWSPKIWTYTIQRIQLSNLASARPPHMVMWNGHNYCRPYLNVSNTCKVLFNQQLLRSKRSKRFSLGSFNLALQAKRGVPVNYAWPQMNHLKQYHLLCSIINCSHAFSTTTSWSLQKHWKLCNPKKFSHHWSSMCEPPYLLQITDSESFFGQRFQRLIVTVVSWNHRHLWSMFL